MNCGMNIYFRWEGRLIHMKSKKKKAIIRVLIILAVMNGVWFAFVGFQWGWGVFARLHDLKTASLAGNNPKYALVNVEVENVNELTGKKIIFLGSSVTYGASSMGVSFADYIGKRDQVKIVKKAVSGTTLVDQGLYSYISRMKKLKESDVDLFICQLSTNDATQKKKLGVVSDSKDLDTFDTNTVAGAIEYIICYANETWNCPIMFYTNPRYDSTEYQEMVDLLLKIQNKWDVGVINMWDDTAFNDNAKEQLSLYMADAIHPTQAGYLEWWTPFMEEKIVEYISK